MQPGGGTYGDRRGVPVRPTGCTVRRPTTGQQDQTAGSFAFMKVSGLYHYPIKGLSPQVLPEVRLTPGQGFPFDRVYGI